MKNAILVFIDGTICDMRHRIALRGTPEFFSEENIMKDTPTWGSVECISMLAKKHVIVYIGARSDEYLEMTAEWLRKAGFPDGEVYLGKNQQERMRIVLEIKKKYRFHAGISDRWDDNELHLALGCMSIILKEWEPDWNTVRRYIE